MNLLCTCLEFECTTDQFVLVIRPSFDVTLGTPQFVFRLYGAHVRSSTHHTFCVTSLSSFVHWAIVCNLSFLNSFSASTLFPITLKHLLTILSPKQNKHPKVSVNADFLIFLTSTFLGLNSQSTSVWELFIGQAKLFFLTPDFFVLLRVNIELRQLWQAHQFLLSLWSPEIV